MSLSSLSFESYPSNYEPSASNLQPRQELEDFHSLHEDRLTHLEVANAQLAEEVRDAENKMSASS
jgi:tRNA(Ile)-lysidine synthase TilS/MesJ